MRPAPVRRPAPRRALVPLLGALALLAAATPALAAVQAPGPTSASFVTYTAPDEIARDAGEPTLGVNWNTGKVLFQAFTETDQVTFDDSVFPATAAWKDVSRPPTDLVSLDPILETDPVTGRTLVSQLAPPCSIAAFTDSDGEPTATNPNGYAPSAACGVGSNFDHQTVHFGKAVNPELSPAYGPGRVAWYCSQVVAESTCSVSRNGGIAFEQSRPAYTFRGDLITDNLIVGCQGLHGHLNTSPVDGTAYLPNASCNSAERLDVNRPAVVVSADEGLSWTIRQVPDALSPNFDSDPAVDVDEANRAYVAYEDDSNNMMMAVTTDRGETFTPSIDLGAPFGIKNATMPTVQAGSDGRAAVAFFGTVAEAPLFEGEDARPENQLLSFDPDGNDPEAGWHLYLSMTYDGGVTWTTSDLTPDDPVQRGCIWWGSAQGDQPSEQDCQNNKRNLLDFIDVAVDKQGRVVVGWADGCVNACVTQGHTRNSNLAFADRPAEDMALTRQQFDELYSQEDIGAISRQSCGLGLYSAFDDADDGPNLTCARLTGAAPVPALTPAAAASDAPSPAAGTVTAAPGSAAGAVGSSEPQQVSGARLPSTGVTPLVAITAAAAVAAAAALRRRRRVG